MSVRKLAGLAAAFSLAVGLIGVGVSAQFTSSVTAQENINVGTFGCQIVDATPIGASNGIALNGKSVTYTAPTISSSDPGSAPFSFTVKNTGTIPQVLTVATTPAVSTPWSIINAPFAPVALAGGASHPYSTGVAWTTLGNSNLDQHFSVTWTVSCNESSVGVAYYAVNNGGTQFAPGVWVRSTSPIASTAVVGGGTATQSASGSGVHLAITGQTSYADTGFYVPFGTLGSLASSGYTVMGTGSDFGTNVYFDASLNGEFFGWTSNYMSSIAGDAYGLGPTSVAGTLTVTGASTYAMTCNGVYSNYSLTTLASTGCTEGVSASTPVAVWVGITALGAGDLSTTITLAP
jgi:hypothetical protein